MVEQANSRSGSSSTVEMDTVLELLEKTVLLIVFSTLYRFLKQKKRPQDIAIDNT